MRVDFEDGQWAEVWGVREMPRRVTAHIEDMLADTSEEESGFAAMRTVTRMRETLMAMLLKQWSYDTTLTGNLEDVHALPQASYDKLKDETEEHWAKAGFRTRATEEEPEDSTPASSTSSG